MAYSYTIKEDYQNALKLYNNSIQMAEDIGRKNLVGYIYKDMGYHIYLNKMDLDSALYYSNKANLILDDVGNKHGLSRSLIQIGDIHRIIGDYDKALKNYSAALKINENEKRFSIGAYYRLGQLYFSNKNYQKALEHLGKYVDLRKEVLDKSPSLSALTLISLARKNSGKSYELKVIKELINEADDIGYSTNFHLYKLFDDFKYLKNAHEKLQNRADKLEDTFKKKLYNYPIPKLIIKYQKNINS